MTILLGVEHLLKWLQMGMLKFNFKIWDPTLEMLGFTLSCLWECDWVQGHSPNPLLLSCLNFSHEPKARVMTKGLGKITSMNCNLGKQNWQAQTTHKWEEILSWSTKKGCYIYVMTKNQVTKWTFDLQARAHILSTTPWCEIWNKNLINKLLARL